jgi:hypothetical protein
MQEQSSLTTEMSYENAVGLNKTGTKIIEIIGPPGVGKSTIYKSVLRKWNSSLNWIGQEQLLSLKRPSLTQFRLWQEYQFRKLLQKKDKVVIPVDFGLRFVDKNKALANFLWNHLSFSKAYNEHEIGKQFRSAYFLFREFSRYQAIWERHSTKPCIIDEGLLVKSFFVMEDEQAMINLMDNYLPILPLPHAIIYIDTPQVEVIADRVINRKKIIASHIGKSKTALLEDLRKWQVLFALVTSRMEYYHVPVFKLDGLAPINDNVASLAAILNNVIKLPDDFINIDKEANKP